MARADIPISTNVSANLRAGTQSKCPVKTSASVYEFWIDTGTTDLYYAKSTDGGINFGVPVSIKAATVAQVSVWFDQWTPSDAGTKIHIAYAETDADDVLYRSLDTASDTLGTETTIFAGASGLSNNAGTCISIAKMRGGNLLCMFDIDGGTEVGLYRSVDAGANWTVRTNPAEGGDYFQVFPGFAADNQDAIIIFWDASASEISRKLYDDSADSTAETSISTGMTRVASTTCAPQFAGTVDAVNSRIILAAWNSRDVSTSDLNTWWITESAITAKTDIVTNSDDAQCVALSLATDSNTLYGFYLGKSDGSETVGTSVNGYYKTSNDYGATWGSETLFTTGAKNFDMLYAPLTFTGDFGCEILATIADPANRTLYYSALMPAGGMSSNIVVSQGVKRSNL